MKKFLLIGGLGTVGAVVIGAIWLFVYASGLQTTGAKKEAALTAQYSNDQNEYSNYSASIVESLGVAEEKMGKVTDLITSYVSGRKSEGSGQLATLVKEAVPDLGSASIYDKIVDAILAGREKFKNQQSKMLANIQDFETWQNSGLIQPRIIRLLGFPSQNLRATVGSESVYGQEALTKMRTIVTTATSQGTFRSGTDAPLIQPKGGKAGAGNQGK
jgi:hypothetical protein